MGKKVLLGMSGGVDSSVSAILLKKQGYEVIGATLILWEDEKKGSTKDVVENPILDAKKICEKLGIEHHVIDFKKAFEKRVIDNFVCTYMCAKTPNPCVECNKFMKFEAFYKVAKELGCEYIATGHYARIYYSEQFKQYVLAKSDAEAKDQSYFLYGINKKILPYVIFPLDSFESKEEIRKIAKENELEVANKKDSQEVCFIPDNDYIGFLNKRLKTKSKRGNIVLKDGTILGTHNGLIKYTVGQRKGLNISYKEPLYVLELNAKTNEVIVGTENELYQHTLYANELNFLLDIDLNKPIEIKAKIRYRAKEADAILYPPEEGKVKVQFKEAQRAITPGQSIVFYINNIVVGGGKII